MKLQHLAVIFIIIILPISLVLASYIQNQIEAIEIQTNYDKNLINATYDAVKAFQINTTNNKYSSISDSKIRDIEASINTFYNSLLTSMMQYAQTGVDLQNFTPALLFTLYDGYYIYTSNRNVYSTDEEGIVHVDLDEKEYSNGLKPYVYYSAKYRLKNGNVIIVNYTLDNAITVYGDFGDGYVTKSGYLIDPDSVTLHPETHSLTYDSTDNGKADGIEIEPEILTDHLSIVTDETTMTTQGGDYQYVFYGNEKIYLDHDANGNSLFYTADGNTTANYSASTRIPVIFWYQNYIKTYVNDPDIRNDIASNIAVDGNGKAYLISYSAYNFFAEAKEFSEWVNENMSEITQADTLRFEDGSTPIGTTDTTYLSQNTGTEPIFNTKNDNNDPLVSSSVFNNHRLAVIQKSIETNLITVISRYNTNTLLNYAMPVISEEDWYQIVNNVSVVSFMQGLSIGYRFYNNYAVVTNNINKEVVNSNNIYIVADDSSNNREYHQPGCKELLEGVKSGNLTIVGAYSTASFQRQSIRKSENSAEDEYYYLQAKNGKYLTGCYNCIVNNTPNYSIDDIISGAALVDFVNSTENGGTGEISFEAGDSAYIQVREAYMTALARERYDIYKSNFDLGL